MNSTQVKLERAPHPGEVITEYLDWKGWSQQELARRSGLTAKTISEICNGKAPVSAQSALALEPVLGRPAHLWMGLQRRFDEMQARKGLHSRQSDWGEWAKKFPLKEMISHDWIKAQEHDPLPDLLHFFGVASPDSWSNTWDGMRVAYRRADLVHLNQFATATWVRATELEAASIETKSFNEKKATLLVQQLRSMTRRPPEEYFSDWREACAAAGIALVVLPQLKGTSISGCARWLTDSKAVIALTPRYKTDDQLWLTFFHELGHLLLHRKKFRFILDTAEESVAEGIVDLEMVKFEKEANEFAEEALISSSSFATFTTRDSYSCASIERFATEIGVGPGVVVGRLQREGFIAYHSCNQLKRKISIAQA